MVALALIASACTAESENAEELSDAEPAADASAADPQVPQDLRDLQSFRLSMERIDKYIATMTNVGRRISSLSPEEREGAAQQAMGQDPNASLDDMVQAAEANETIREAAREAGSSPREYVMTGMAYMQAGMAAAVAQMQPQANQDSLARAMQANPDNMAFVRDNQAALTTKFEAAQAEWEKMGMEN